MECGVTLQAGTATVDLTPPSGSLMACFPTGPDRTPRRARGAHDPLKARALALSDGETMAVIVACDLCGIRRVDVERVRAHVAAQTSALDKSHVVLAASHSHSSLESLYLFGNTPADPFILDMDRRLAEAVVKACGNLTPVRVTWAALPVDLNHNRRVVGSDGRATQVVEYRSGVTEGPVDPELAVVSLETDGGETRAVLFRYTAHALTVGPGNLLYTADYPGQACAVVEAALPGCVALFLNGAAGNVHPKECMRTDFQVMNRVGAALGEAVLRARRTAKEMDPVGLRFVRDVLVFPNRVRSELKVTVELACLRLGDVVFGFAPGEVFVEHQLRFRRELLPAPGVFVGYANGWPGYIPTKESYSQGGYGVDLCATDPPEYSRTALPPGAGEQMLDRLLELSRQIL